MKNKIPEGVGSRPHRGPVSSAMNNLAEGSELQMGYTGNKI